MSPTPFIEFVRLTCAARSAYGVQVFSKDRKWTLLWKAIDKILMILSRGKNKGFYKNFTTTIGPYIFFPAGWRSQDADIVDCVTLQHEIEHVAWYAKAGLGSAWLGLPILGLLYLLFPVPIGFAWFRYAMERAGYKKSIEAWKHYGVNVDKTYYVETISGPGYLWPWPKKWVTQWFQKNC